MSVLDFDRLDEIACRRRAEFAAADPFPHVVIDDFLPEEIAAGVAAEFDRNAPAWKHYHHFNERKLAITDLHRMGTSAQALFGALQSDRFVRAMETLTGIDGLLADPDLDGAGMHLSLAGGFLNMHTDFLSHPKNRQWSRQVNLLIYLNRDWRDAWGGDLEFWSPDMKRRVTAVAPTWNRAVVFHTSERSFHGHPQPLACPGNRDRRSLALYYFRDESAVRPPSSTNYRPLPGDPLAKRVGIALDRGALRVYSFVKRHTPVSDGFVSRLLKRL